MNTKTTQPVFLQALGRAADPVLLVALAVAVTLRIPAAWGPAMWRDEAQFAAVVSLPTARDMIGFLANHESHPPLYYLLARGWSELFGTDDGAFAALSFIWGLVVVVAAYSVSLTARSRRAARLAALLAAVSTPLVFNAGSARPYAFLGVAGLLSTWLAWRLTVGERPKAAAIPYAVAALAMIYTHHWAWLLVGAQGLLGLVFSGRRDSSRRWTGWILAVVCVLVLYLPWAPTLLRQLRQAGHPKGSLSVGERLSQCFLMATGMDPRIAGLLGLGIATLVLLGHRQGNGLGTRHRDANQLRFWVALPVVTVGLAVAAYPVTNLLVRHACSILTPLVCVAVAMLLERERARWHRAGATASVAVVLVSGCYALWWARLERSTVRLVTQYIAGQERARGTLVIVPIYLAPSFERYYRGQGEIRAFPDEAHLSPIEFDNRPARDTAWAELSSLLRRVRMAADRGEDVWYVVGGKLGDVGPMGEQVQKALQSVYGNPWVTGVGEGREAFFEVVLATLYVAHRAPVDTTDPPTAPP